MKWTRSKDHIAEYSTGYIGLRHYISMVGNCEPDKTVFSYTYSVNGERVFCGHIKANSWDEAEQVVVKKIHNKLRGNVVYWKEMFNNFDKEMSKSETIYSSGTSE